MYTPKKIHLSVARGAAWLDEHEPGWADRIDIQTLNIGDGDECVLGQLYRYANPGYITEGSGAAYSQYTQDMPMLHADRYRHGFIIDCWEDIESSPERDSVTSKEFTAAWTKQITARLGDVVDLGMSVHDLITMLLLQPMEGKVVIRGNMIGVNP